MLELNIGNDDLDRRLRDALSAALRRSPLSRSEVAAEMTKRLGTRITAVMLNEYTAEAKKKARFPLLFSAALSEILDDDSIALFGVRPRIRRLVEFAERELAGFRDQRERESLREQLLSCLESKGGAR